MINNESTHIKEDGEFYQSEEDEKELNDVSVSH
jgi:hypothetical protein